MIAQSEWALQALDCQRHATASVSIVLLLYFLVYFLSTFRMFIPCKHSLKSPFISFVCTKVSFVERF